MVAVEMEKCYSRISGVTMVESSIFPDISRVSGDIMVAKMEICDLEFVI
jgi:hypothetical protein